MKCAVIGASDNPARYAYLATKSLLDHGHDVVLYGLRDREVFGLPIHTDLTPLEGVHTITMYVGPQHQAYWTDLIFALQPKRVIFNPGTENPDLIDQLSEAGIECIEACTLVMLSIGNFENTSFPVIDGY